jgi:hypothetical protein
MSTTAYNPPVVSEEEKKFTGFKVECWIDGVVVSKIVTSLEEYSVIDFGFPLFVEERLGSSTVLVGYGLRPDIRRVPSSVNQMETICD